MLAENPHVLKKLREEVLSAVGPSRRPTHEELKSMKYVRAFLNGMVYLRLQLQLLTYLDSETLRLYPPV